MSVCGLDAKSGLVASGPAAGAVHVWAGRNCACVEPTAHAGADGAPFAVEALFYLGAQSKLASGGADGKVKIWKVSVSAVKGAGSKVALGVVAVLDLMILPSAGRAVRSVCLSGDGNKALVHTAGAEVWELSTAPVPDESGDPEKEVPAGASLTEGGGPLMLGAASAVDAMLPAPTGGEFVTGAADGTIRAWDLESHRSVRAETIPNLKGVASFGFNAGGNTLTVGFGDGKVKLLKFADLSEVGEIAAPAAEGADGGPAESAPARAVKFSPDGQSIGVACGGSVTLYEASGAYGEKGACKCSSAVTAFDFSEEPGLLALSTAGLELLFYSLETYEPVAPLEARDRAWFTKSVPLAYNYKGIAPAHKHCGPAGIVAIDAAPAGAAPLCVAADCYGALNVFPYPCVEPPVGYGAFAAHASDGGMCVSFVGEASVLSAGGDDRAIIQWKLDADEAIDEADEAGTAEEPPPADEDEDVEKYVPESGDDEALADGAPLDRAEKSTLFHAVRNDDMGALFALELDAGPEADCFAAVKPWVGNCIAPTTAPEPSKAVPDDDLELEWVHGYAGQSARGNVRYNTSGEVVYYSASVAVALDKTARTQRFMAEHTDDITALAMHPAGVLCATGQRGVTPSIIVWDSTSAATKCSLKLNKGGRASSTRAAARSRRWRSRPTAPCSSRRRRTTSTRCTSSTGRRGCCSTAWRGCCSTA